MTTVCTCGAKILTVYDGARCSCGRDLSPGAAAPDEDTADLPEGWEAVAAQDRPFAPKDVQEEIARLLGDLRYHQELSAEAAVTHGIERYGRVKSEFEAALVKLGRALMRARGYDERSLRL